MALRAATVHENSIFVLNFPEGLYNLYHHAI
jgi:hypothetical protein